VRAEDRQAAGAFNEIRNQREETHGRAEQKADQQYGKGLQRNRDRRERQRHGDMGAQGDEAGGAESKENATLQRPEVCPCGRERLCIDE
jgi:hypothetical protein